MKTQTVVETLLIAFVFILIISGIVVYPILLNGSKREVTDTVLKTERVCSIGESGTCQYLVFGRKEVYSNSDSLLAWKFNSSDFYRDIEQGKTYKFTIWGWRIPFFSSYRNIISISSPDKE